MDEKQKTIWTVKEKKQEALLRKKSVFFDFTKHSKKEISDLVLHMRKMMVANHGVGLAAPQIGISQQIFVAQLPGDDGFGYKGKFYAFFNPKIESVSLKTIPQAEGCLSVPGFYGTVQRADKITISGFDKNQRSITIKAEGFLARIFQHEIDHLNGTLYIDKATKIAKINDTDISD